MSEVRTRSAGHRSGARAEMPLSRVVRIAEFRAGLRTFLRQSERVSRKWGLTPRWYLLLLFIKGSPGGDERLSFTELTRRLQLSKNTVTELVRRAEDAGLVARERADHDQRVVYLRLTEEGEQRLAGALHESDQYRRELIRAFEHLVATFREAARR